MQKKQALYQSLASAGATLVAFIGVIHEYAGHLIFPWAPRAAGGPIGWHALGIFAIIAGVALLAGTLNLLDFPVVALSLTLAVMGAVIAFLTAILYDEFHLIAVTGSLASCVTAYCHRRAVDVFSDNAEGVDVRRRARR